MDAVLALGALIVGLVVIGGATWGLIRSQRRRAADKAARELEPVKKLAFEDVTALGVQLQELDLELAGQPLDEGARADYQRALDAYESAKHAGDYLAKAEDITHVTEIIEDGRYAIDCVRARVAGRPLPQRRPPCFFDPRHGLSVTDVPWSPEGGTVRQVPACALDAERVRAGAEPDTRKVMVGSRRVPYWQGGPAYQPYAQGYFGAFSPLDWMFMGLMFNGLGEGLGGLAEGVGEGMGDLFSGIGDMFDGFDL